METIKNIAITLLLLLVLFVLFAASVQNKKASCEPQKNQEYKSIDCQINDNLTK